MSFSFDCTFSVRRYKCNLLDTHFFKTTISVLPSLDWLPCVLEGIFSIIVVKMQFGMQSIKCTSCMSVKNSLNILLTFPALLARIFFVKIFCEFLECQFYQMSYLIGFKGIISYWFWKVSQEQRICKTRHSELSVSTVLLK